MNLQQVTERRPVEHLRTEMLDADELFLLQYIQSFNRRSAKEWSDRGLLDFSSELED